MAKSFIILDVEGYSTCAPYNVGFLVGDKNGNIYEEYNFAIMPALYENMCYKLEKLNVSGLQIAHEMFHKNAHEILNDNTNKYEKVYNANIVYEKLIQVISKHNIKKIWAYNCSFDKGSLKRLFNNQQMEVLENLVTFCDIIPAILHTRLLTKKYVNFCKKNGFLTEKGNVQTKAEIVYRYLTGNLQFVEEHTGLADCRVEHQILITAMKRAKNPHHKPCVAWKILQKFCQEKGIEIPAIIDK